MSQSEQFLYHLVVKDDANAAIAKTSAAALNLGGAVDKVRTSFASVGEGAKALQSRMAPAAAAISGIGGAMGAAGGQAAKWANAAAQGAAAFGAAGPWGVALVGGTLLLDEYMKTQAESTRALGVWRQQVTATTPAQRAYADSVKAIADEAKRMGEIIEETGKNEFQVRIARATALKVELETNLANIETNARLTQANVNAAESALASARARGAGIAEATEAYELQLSIQGKIAANAESYRGQVANLEASVWKIADAWAAVEKAPKKGAGGPGAAVNDNVEAVFDDTSFGGVTLEGQRELADRRFQLQEAAREREAKAYADAQNREIQAEAFKNAELVRLDREKNDKIAANVDAFRREQSSQAEAAFSIAAAGLTTLVSESIAGQEKALERFGVSVMAQAGQSLVASGTKLGGEAIYSALTGNLPAAGAQAAGAAALIGSGIALGGVAGGLSGLLGGAGGSGGGRRPAAPRAADEAPRFASRGAGGAGGGGMNVTIVYSGVSGPTADQGARASVDAWRRARARGEAA